MEKEKMNPEEEEVVENEVDDATEETSEATPSREEELEKELAASKEAHIRTLAEYDNYRKRSVKEKEATYNDSKANVLKELLPVLDNFERAMSADNDLEALKQGMNMIFTNITNIFEKLGVESFGESGDKFDPNIHNAVMHIEDEKFGENEVAQVFSKGYKLGDRIIRPAMVQVAN